MFQLLAYLFISASLFYGGWHAHTVYDGYLNERQAVVEAQKAREAELKIAQFNRDYAKEKANAPHDNCIDTKHPAWVNGVLNE